ncbi:unnamed protein product [Ixodes pacificus]
MAVLACQCLNWSVHCQESRVEACDPRHLDLSEEERTDRFFASAVARVKLGIGGISQKHPFLSTVRHVGQWSVHSCRGCRQDVYAEASGRMLLNAGLESGQEKMDMLRALERYSPCFKIVLPLPGDDDDGSRGKSCVSGARLQVEDSKLDANLKVVQEIASRFVRQEMEAMEARIRHFQEQQSRTLEQLKARTSVDRDALCELLMQASRRELKNTLAEALDEEVTQRIMAVRSNAVATTQNRGGLPKTTDNDRDTGITFQKGAARRQGVRRPARPGRQLLLSQSVDTGQIFHLDGFEDEDNSAPFPPASSEEELDTDDSSMADEYQPTGQTQCAYSLPVDMPTWRTPRDSQNDLDELVGAVDHEKIGEDIEALARSVCDGTEMFGDLPRPRLNAGDHRSRPL